MGVHVSSRSARVCMNSHPPSGHVSGAGEADEGEARSYHTHRRSDAFALAFAAIHTCFSSTSFSAGLCSAGKEAGSRACVGERTRGQREGICEKVSLVAGGKRHLSEPGPHPRGKHRGVRAPTGCCPVPARGQRRCTAQGQYPQMEFWASGSSPAQIKPVSTESSINDVSYKGKPHLKPVRASREHSGCVYQISSWAQGGREGGGGERGALAAPGLRGKPPHHRHFPPTF